VDVYISIDVINWTALLIPMKFHKSDEVVCKGQFPECPSMANDKDCTSCPLYKKK
jgi:hypothetical protein